MSQETPRTDEVVAHLGASACPESTLARHASQLERELNECRKERDALQKRVKLLMEAQGIEESTREEMRHTEVLLRTQIKALIAENSKHWMEL